MCVGAYIGCFCANYMHAVIPSKLAVLVISMLIGGISAAVFGLIIGLPCLRLKGDYLAIVTLAFGEIVRTVFMNQPVFGGAIGLTTQKYGKNLYIIAFVVVLFTVFVSQNLMRSKHGRAIQSIRDNEIASRAMGVNVTYYKLIIFVISAFFAGVAGVIYGHSTTPVDYSFFSFNYSIEILVMVVLGGQHQRLHHLGGCAHFHQRKAPDSALRRPCGTETAHLRAHPHRNGNVEQRARSPWNPRKGEYQKPYRLLHGKGAEKARENTGRRHRSSGKRVLG